MSTAEDKMGRALLVVLVGVVVAGFAGGAVLWATFFAILRLVGLL